MQTALTLTAAQAALISLWICVVMTRSTGFSSTAFRFSPLMTSLIVGLVMHNVPEALAIGAGIQLIYMGVIAPGGTTPSEPAVATAIAIPVALLSKVGTTAAIAVAVPVGLLGAYLYQFRFFLNTLVVTPLAEKNIKTLDDRKITLSLTVVPILIGFILFFPIMFITLYKGVPFITKLVESLSGSAIHVLTAIGGALPAVGIAITLKVIGKKKFIPFFVLAYFLAVVLQSLNVNTVIYAILGGILAILYTTLASRGEAEEEETEGAESAAPAVGKLTDRDLRGAWSRWRYLNEICHTFDRMIAFSFLWALMPSLRKLYKSKEDLQDAYERNAQFFNTECIGGAPIVGAALSLEEQRATALAEGRKDEAVSADVIQSTKVGLMGPFAALGDSVEEGTIQYIWIALFLPLCKAGNFLGAVLPWLVWVLADYVYGFYFFKMGYKMGLSAASRILSSKTMKNVIAGLSILGLFMMGILTASYVKVSSPLTWAISGKVFKLQDILDSVLPGLLPFLAVVGTYVYFDKKGIKTLRAIIGLVIIVGVLAALNVL